jgi:hypothetical protein
MNPEVYDNLMILKYEEVYKFMIISIGVKFDFLTIGRRGVISSHCLLKSCESNLFNFFLYYNRAVTW